jgi:hypothetical protein
MNAEPHAAQQWSERWCEEIHGDGGGGGEWDPDSSMGSWIASHCAGDRRLLLAFIVPIHPSVVEQDHTPSRTTS